MAMHKSAASSAGPGYPGPPHPILTRAALVDLILRVRRGRLYIFDLVLQLPSLMEQAPLGHVQRSVLLSVVAEALYDPIPVRVGLYGIVEPKGARSFDPHAFRIPVLFIIEHNRHHRRTPLRLPCLRRHHPPTKSISTFQGRTGAPFSCRPEPRRPPPAPSQAEGPRDATRGWQRHARRPERTPGFRRRPLRSVRSARLARTCGPRSHRPALHKYPPVTPERLVGFLDASAPSLSWCSSVCYFGSGSRGATVASLGSARRVARQVLLGVRAHGREFLNSLNRAGL